MSVKAHEFFINLPDLESNIDSQKFVVTNTSWFSQIIVAESESIQNLYFLVGGNSSTKGLVISIHSVTGAGSSFAPDTSSGGTLVTASHPETGVTEFTEINTSDTSPLGRWYRTNFSTNVSLTLGATYAIVFKTTSGTLAPELFYSLDYRQATNPQVIGSTDGGTSWSNSVIGTPFSGNLRTGAICFGQLGDEVNNSTNFFNSGSQTIGGRSTSNRGYPVFLYVERTTTTTDVEVEFRQLPPAQILLGTSEETEQSMMRWYFIEEGEIPVNGNLTPLLHKTTDTPVLGATAGFVLFMQPDRLAPLSTPYFPENKMDMYASPVGIVPLYESTPNFVIGTGTDSAENVQSEFSIDSTDRFSSNYWAHLRRDSVTTTTGGQRDAGISTTTSPSYFDFSTEKPGEDITLLQRVTLQASVLDSVDGNEDAIVRGLNESVYYKGKYIFFCKKNSFEDSGVSIPSITGAGTGLAYMIDGDLESFTRKTFTVVDSSPTTLQGGNGNQYIIGVHDAVVRIINGTETLLVIFQTLRDASFDTTQAYFDVGYYQGDITASNYAFQLLRITAGSTQDGSDARYTHGSTTSGHMNEVDRKMAFFITPNFGNGVYITARNVDYGLAIWKIGFGDDITSAGYSPAQIAANSDTPNINRGIADRFDIGISSWFNDGNVTYLGTETYDATTDTVQLARAYSMSFSEGQEQFEQILGGDVNDPPAWMIGYSISPANNEVKYMKRVGRIIHFWTSPSHIYDSTATPKEQSTPYSATNTPHHIAVDTFDKQPLLLRQFPIEDGAGDPTYAQTPTISNFDEDLGRSKHLRMFQGGDVSGHLIYVYGADSVTEAVDTALNSDNYTNYGTRWLVYDDRTINQAFEFYNDNTTGVISASSTILLPIDFQGTGLNDMTLFSTSYTDTTNKQYTIEIFDGQVIAYSNPIGTFTVGAILSGTSATGTIVQVLEGVPAGSNTVYVTGITGGTFGNGEALTDDAGSPATGTSTSAQFDSYRWSNSEGALAEWLPMGTTVITLPLDSNNTQIQFAAITGHTGGDKWVFSGVMSTRKGFPLMNGRGVYHGKSIGVIRHDETDPVYDTYPTLHPDAIEVGTAPNNIPNFESHPRVSIYCGAINYGGSTLDGIENDNTNLPSKVFSLNGINYMITNNVNRGIRLFKSYGVKQLPENWGEPGYGGNNIDTYTSLDIDKANFELGVGGYNSFEFVARNSKVVIVNGIAFVLEMKRNGTSASEWYLVNNNFPDRSILALTNGLRRPQAISMNYQINPIIDESDAGFAALLTNVADTRTSETMLTIKTARTIEDLFFDPTDIVQIPLAQAIDTSTQSTHDFLRHVFPTDTDANFFRIETNKLYPVSGTPNVRVQVKSLKLHDVDVGGPVEGTNKKSAIINGIVDEGGSGRPENITNANGVELNKNGEIIIDLIKPIYISEISFNVRIAQLEPESANQAEFEIDFLPRFEKETFGPDLVAEADWVKLGDTIQVGFDTAEGQIKKDGIGIYARAFRIRLVDAALSLIVKDLTVKSFTGTTNQFSSAGNVSSPELVIVDDAFALVGSNPGSRPTAFATLNSSGSYVEIDLEQDVPVSRISFNTFSGGDSTRTISVDVWDGSILLSGQPSFENLYTNTVKDYEFSVVRWSPRQKDKSRIVDIDFLSQEELESQSDINEFFRQFNTDNTARLKSSGLSGYTLRPNIFKDRSLTIVKSSNEFIQPYNGNVTVNSQMDEDGPFSSDLKNESLGLIERTVNVDFPLRQIRRIRIKLDNQSGGDSNVRINGLRLHSPLIDENGLAGWPRSGVQWTIQLIATTTE